jgi:hypothetical protein
VDGARAGFEGHGVGFVVRDQRIEGEIVSRSRFEVGERDGQIGTRTSTENRGMNDCFRTQLLEPNIPESLDDAKHLEMPKKTQIILSVFDWQSFNAKHLQNITIHRKKSHPIT